VLALGQGSEKLMPRAGQRVASARIPGREVQVPKGMEAGLLLPKGRAAGVELSVG
jgi:hypothetical protein